jgi:hypothetical protein
VLFAATVRLAAGRALLGPLEGALVLDALESMRRKGLARLHAFVVLPAQVSLLLSADDQAAAAHAIQVWEKFAARQIGQLRSESGLLWEKDRTLEPVDQVQRVLQELLALPVNAGLAPAPEAYALCSAHLQKVLRVDPLP